MFVGVIVEVGSAVILLYGSPLRNLAKAIPQAIVVDVAGVVGEVSLVLLKKTRCAWSGVEEPAGTMPATQGNREMQAMGNGTTVTGNW